VTPTDSVFLLASATSLGLAVMAVARPPRGLLRWSFALAMLGFAAEAGAAFVLVARTETPDERVVWLKTLEIAGLLVLAPLAVFVAALARPAGFERSRGLWIGLGAVVAGLAGCAVAVGVLPAFQVAEVPGSFYAARVDTVGRVAVALQIAVTVILLAGLEAALRASRRDARWRIKYLVLGLGGVLLARFYFLSQTVLFNVLMASYPVTEAATLLIGSVAIAASLVRDRLGVELAVSRQVLYGSVTVSVLGVYLLAVGLLGWVLNHLGIGEELFFGSVVVFVSALALAALLLSEAVRWRVKRLLTRHFYRSKYDYREQWVAFTKRLGSLVTVDDLAPQLLGVVVETVGARVGLLYLADDRDRRLHAASAVGVGRPQEPLAGDHPLVASLATRTAPIVFGDSGAEHWLEAPAARLFPEGSVMVPLRRRSELTGLLLIGPERTGTPYTTEDFEFLETVGQQAAGVIVSARLSEKLAQSREFEAFHRLTSFVIHDIKNSISALSMLSENALRHFDDPEFRQDALKTLARTVDRMKALMGRLSSAPEAAALRMEPVDFGALLQEAVKPIAKNDRISLVTELAPVPPVLGDAEALLRVVQNLVTNAAQSIADHGVVTVRTSEQDGYVVLAVADTGCGMSEEFVRTSLFAPFRSTKKGGWGIGLYQVKGIVEGHGGSIEVASKEGAGTVFSIKLRIAQ